MPRGRSAEEMRAQAAKAAGARWHPDGGVEAPEDDLGDLIPPKAGQQAPPSSPTPESPERPDILDFATSPRYLNLSLSLGQRALLKVVYGLELDPEELQAFQLCTGRSADPRTSFRNLVVIAGARAGKDSRLVAVMALYEMAFGDHKVAKGETATIALFAQDAA
jgi:hypothetical protein